MRIVLTCNYSPWSAYSGGGQRSTHQLASALTDLGHDVTVIYTAPRWSRPLPDEPVKYRIEWAFFFGLRSTRSAPLRPLNAISVRHVLRRLHAELPIDVVHGQGEESALSGAWCRAQGIQFVVTPRFPWYPQALSPTQPLLSRVLMWSRDPKYRVLGWAIRDAVCVCPTSRSAADNVRQAYGVSEKKITVVPNGIHAAFFGEDWRGETDAPLLFYGRLHHDKGADVALRAAAAVGKPIEIVGRGDDLESLKKLTVELKSQARVTWTSWLSPEDLAHRIASSSAVLLPSHNESFGNVMAETLAVGAPLVTTNAGSIPEVVGDCAIMTSPGDVQAVIEALDDIAGDAGGARARSLAGRDRMRSHFSWAAVAKQFVSIYTASRTAPSV